MFNPRIHQAEILKYRGGKLGVSAVPGSGKTHTLSMLAANLIASDLVNDDQEVLIVTLVNSAVDNFSNRISSFIKHRGLLPGMGYKVRTLHGLAYDLVKERPSLANLSDEFTILDEKDGNEIVQSLTASWMKINQTFLEEWTDSQVLQQKPIQSLLQQWEKSLQPLAKNFITKAKDLNLLPHEIKERYKRSGISNNFLEFAMEVYDGYQSILAIRSAVDFNDLTRLALQILRTDSDLLSRLQYKWPYILEDEAQDSSQVQESILSLLSGEHGNWVRVGDPNQAIYETFTTASPELLKRFIRRDDVKSLDLPESGRSMQSVIKLANELIRWTLNSHPEKNLRQSLSLPYIQPVQPGDPQPNPADEPGAVQFIDRRFDPEDELVKVASSVKIRLAEFPDETTAVLVPRNVRGAKLVDEFKRIGIEPVELLESNQSTRDVIRKLASILQINAHPNDRHKLAEVYKNLYRTTAMKTDSVDLYTQTLKLIADKVNLEEFLWPTGDKDWLWQLQTSGVDSHALDALTAFRARVQKWQSASQLPVDQFILTISNDIFTAPSDLALSYYISVWLRQRANLHPDWGLVEFIAELESVLRNEHKLIGFSDDDLGFNPDAHKGKVVVSTIHKAKGLEWDKVYLISMNNYDFPSLQSYDQYISERWFVKDQINIEAGTLADLEYLAGEEQRLSWLEASEQARIDYSAERLRLFYVGITRAKKGLSVTWNRGQSISEKQENLPSLPFSHLAGFVKGGGLEAS